MTLLTLSLTLFLIMDSIGNVSTFLRMVEDIPKKRLNWIIFREMFIALGMMVLFNYIGDYIFDFISVSETAVMFSAGIILFLTALKIIFPADDSPRSNIKKGEPFIVPLAIPMIAGPSLLATIMLFSHMEGDCCSMLVAILIAWGASMVVLLGSSLLKSVLGKNGLSALERLLALILVMLAIQRFMDGVRLFMKTYG